MTGIVIVGSWIQGGVSLRAVAEIVFWASAGLLFYVYAGYPLLLGLVAAFCRRRTRETGYTPSLSVLIAAYNEEQSIGPKVRQTLALEYPPEKLEVIVASDGSTDRTDSIVKEFADPRVRLIRVAERKGKTHAQNEAVRECRGEVIVFSDATTVYHSKALLYLACHYADPQVGAVSGRYRYVDPEGRSPTARGMIAFWDYENLIKKLQSRIRTLTGCSGCIYSVRKGVYTELGHDVISDLTQPLHVIRQGYRVVFEDRALAYEETTQSAGEEFGMRVRVITRAIDGLLSVGDLLKPWKSGWVSFQLLSHKVLRWIVPLFLILLFLSSAFLVEQAGFRYLFFFQLFFYLLGAFSIWVPWRRWWKPLALPLYFCTVNAAALYSMIALFRGRGGKYVTWNTVRR